MKVLILLLALTTGYTGEQLPPARIEFLPEPREEIESHPLVEEHNRIRRRHGLRPFQEHPQLMRSAQSHAERMASMRILRHQNLQNLMRALNGFRRIGENIAQGQRNEREAVSDWMRSPGHRGNILNSRYVYIGVGEHQSYWCVIFASD